MTIKHNPHNAPVFEFGKFYGIGLLDGEETTDGSLAVMLSRDRVPGGMMEDASPEDVARIIKPDLFLVFNDSEGLLALIIALMMLHEGPEGAGIKMLLEWHKSQQGGKDESQH